MCEHMHRPDPEGLSFHIIKYLCDGSPISIPGWPSEKKYFPLTSVETLVTTEDTLSIIHLTLNKKYFCFLQYRNVPF